MNSNKEIRRKEKEQKKHVRFIYKIVKEAKINCRKTFEATEQKATIVRYDKDKWEKIKNNLQEINSILEKENIKLELDNPKLKEYEVRIVEL